MSPPVDKAAIASSFGNAADSYDDAAHLQQQVAAEVMASIPESISPTVVVDLGCGTGVHTAELQMRYPQAMVLGCDLSFGMLQHATDCHAQPLWCGGDAESLPLRSNSIDLLFSSLAIQWCDQFSAVLSEVYRCLRPGGQFVFSTLCEGTLHELRTAWEQVDRFSHVNDYPSFNSLEVDVERSGFRVAQLSTAPRRLYYRRVSQLSRELLALGANTLTGERRPGLMTPSRLRALQLGYEQFRDDQQLLPATYQVVYARLIKESELC
ncbi:malonyl-ACP O-methyltransferase BioC [Aestuariirhabdus sp. Z084]|uniref:malonyl-ACP O-methyltransferase BioC n=1 Tax=Aestuariirhabdus haliotis TaxID=2918751 RepID=UPI00201B40BE|nr:malonyl-ACP O-methyltransferase BioC [Aestuariirhabdus haliotis]MCL6414937.1 malonyl-ACP O-methyltransferase BioC [Aestuariirhabdus haliotis]MCL6418869.1 malonyl-ACP O-methyltransferase BioC [Aestuariirhabdus haliotis]